MSLKLSRNKVNHLANLVTAHLQKTDNVDYTQDVGNIRFKIYHLIMDELKLYERIETVSKERINSQKRSVPDGSREWEILFRKFATEELTKLGKVWE